MSGFYSVKQKLSTNFPLYLYPAQNSLMDLICVQNSNNKKILYLELGIFIETKLNEIDLKNADLEA